MSAFMSAEEEIICSCLPDACLVVFALQTGLV